MNRQRIEIVRDSLPSILADEVLDATAEEVDRELRAFESEQFGQARAVALKAIHLAGLEGGDGAYEATHAVLAVFRGDSVPEEEKPNG